mmetsp:Transcript_626/g.2321  ORF Transcript_626/g.2321 Transcript_626/m.2321 type:complete len:314 (+) Transcript_626:852-1793(+)
MTCVSSLSRCQELLYSNRFRERMRILGSRQSHIRLVASRRSLHWLQNQALSLSSFSGLVNCSMQSVSWTVLRRQSPSAKVSLGCSTTDSNAYTCKRSLQAPLLFQSKPRKMYPSVPSASSCSLRSQSLSISPSSSSMYTRDSLPSASGSRLGSVAGRPFGCTRNMFASRIIPASNSSLRDSSKDVDANLRTCKYACRLSSRREAIRGTVTGSGSLKRRVSTSPSFMASLLSAVHCPCSRKNFTEGLGFTAVWIRRGGVSLVVSIESSPAPSGPGSSPVGVSSQSIPSDLARSSTLFSYCFSRAGSLARPTSTS